LLGEYAVVAVRFDGGELLRLGGYFTKLSAAGELFTFATVVLSAGLLLQARQLRAALNHVAADVNALSPPWFVAHFAAFAACFACASALFAQTAANPLGLLLASGGLFCGIVSVATLGRALFGPASFLLGQVLGRAAWAGAVLGLSAWLAGVQTRPCWPVLARATLALASTLLRQVSASEVYVDAASATLGFGHFEVEIAPACSGVEGMALVAIFVSGYLYRFRRELRLRRALLLLPVAIGAAFVANAVRIAALVALGAWWSPDVAFGGFHSKAGWLLFCSLSLGVVLVLDRSPWFTKRAEPASHEHGRIEVDNPTAGYGMPFLAVLATSLVTGAFSSSLDKLYWLRIVVALGALYGSRRYLRTELQLSVSWHAPLLGALVFVLWLWLTPYDAYAARALSTELARLASPARALWLTARVLGTVAVAPLVEELAFRGFLQRRLHSRDFDTLPYTRVGIAGVLGSSLAFGALHPSWFLGAAAGLAYALCTRTKAGLSNAIAAHAVTNLLLAAWALASSRWDLLA